MVEGVVVAAGLSSRADGWKMAFDIGGLTVIERCVLGMVPYCSRVFVVGGARFHLLQALLPKQKYPTVKLIFNRNYEKGMFSSVLAGIRQARARRLLFIPGDYPLVSREVYETLLKKEGEIVIPSYQGVTGHPALLQTGFTDDLFCAPNKYTNLREFILCHNHQIVAVNDPGIVMDIDTREDYLRAVRYFESGNLKISDFRFNQ